MHQHYLHGLDPGKHHVVAIQEPWRYLIQNTTVRLPAYHLVFPRGTRGRSCIYASKNLAVDKWWMETVPIDAERDITSISLQANQGKVWINFAHNPPPSFYCSKDLVTLQWIPQILDKSGYLVLVGDFNLQHLR